MQRNRIAIIGGGLSGLATATHLRLNSGDSPASDSPVNDAAVSDAAVNDAKVDGPCPSLELVLFEANSRLGGVIHSESISTPAGEFTVDHGADMFATNPPAAIELCRELGVEDVLMLPKPQGRGAMIARGNGLIPIPEGFVLMRPTKVMSMLTTPLLSVRGKLRLLLERFVGPRDPSTNDESVGSFTRRRLGQECLDAIVAPLVAGIYTADVDRLSMAATMKPIWDMESSHGSLAKATLGRIRSGEDSTERGSSGARYEQFRAFPGGMIDLIETLAQKVGREHIRCNSPIESIAKTDEGFVIHPSGETFDQIVLTTPAHVSLKLLESLKPSLPESTQREAIDEAVSAMNEISYASTAIVVMAVPRDRIERLPKTFGFVVPPSENRAVLAGSFASEKFGRRAPDDHVIVRAFVGGVLNPKILENDDDAIVAIVAKELGELIGLDHQNLSDHAAFVRVVRWNNAMPQYEVGHLEKVQRIEAAIERIPGIHLRTNAMGGVGIAPVIGAGKRTAKRLLDSC